MKTSTLTKSVLLVLVIGCVVVAPGAGVAIGALIKLWKESQEAGIAPALPEESDPRKVRRSLYRLEKNQYINIRQTGKGKFEFKLTKKGKKLLEKYDFSDLKIKPGQSWDGQWRMFVFDVPEKRRSTRDALRDKLKRLGFFQFQKSVWIYPLKCEEAMNYICEFLDVQSCGLIFTGKIQNDQLLRKYFFRQGILDKSNLQSSSSSRT